MITFIKNHIVYHFLLLLFNFVVLYLQNETDVMKLIDS